MDGRAQSPPGADGARQRWQAPGRRTRRLRWTIALLCGGAIAGGVLGAFLYRASRPEAYRPGEEMADITRALAKELPPEAPRPRFRDVTAQAGLEGFRTFAGPRSSQLPEDMGSGAAWGDFDNDGDEDLVLVASGGALPLAPPERAPSLLYENLGDGTFRRVDDFPEIRIVGMGAAWGDYDGDGWLDLVITGYRSLMLYHNDAGHLSRDARFPEPPGFWAGAAWGDFDNDRDLDLYVCGYVRYEPADADLARVSRQYGKAVPYTLNPSSYEPERNLLFRNEGDGTFSEVAEALGVDNIRGRSLGALWDDFDDDGWLDLYVANDISDNVLYHNTGGKFEEISHSAWVADYRGAMGLASGDWNRDGDDDLFVSHWVAQENALYDSLLSDRGRSAPHAAAGEGSRAEPPAAVQFVDVADQRGLGQIALRFVGWGTEFADLDADGWLDLAVVNGSTFETGASPRVLEPQRPFLFWNRRGEYFYDLAPFGGSLAEPHVARGLALADYDDDGDEDLLVVDHGEGARLLRNEMQTGHWIELRLRNRSPSGALTGFGDGARVLAQIPGATLRRTVASTSYLSQSSRIVHLGLGQARVVPRLEVRWLGGGTSVYSGLESGARWELVEGRPEPERVDIARPASAQETGKPADERVRLVEFWSEQRAAMQAVKVEGDIAAAVDHFRRALAIKPDHADSLYYLANCLALQGDIPGAISILRRLARLNPQSHRAHKRLGVLLALSAASPDELDEASASLSRAASLNPEETGALLALGELALLRGRGEEAEHRLALAARTNPKAAGAFFLRGYMAWSAGDATRARELLARARESLGPDWRPQGMTSEGDVRRTMHDDETPLSRFWERWDGEPDPARAFVEIDAYLHDRGGPSE